MEPLPPDALLRHQDFVRRLARALLRDEHEADDAVQEVWLRALAALPAHQREALVECYLQGQTRQAAAARLGVPLETLRTRLRRGLEGLRNRLDEEFQERRAWAAWLASWEPR